MIKKYSNKKYIDFMKSTGKNVRFWRKQYYGWTQEDFSYRLESSRSYIAKIETGAVGLSIQKLIFISNVLDVNIESLLVVNPSHLYLTSLIRYVNKYKLNKREVEFLYTFTFPSNKKPTFENCEIYFKMLLPNKIK